MTQTIKSIKKSMEANKQLVNYLSSGFEKLDKEIIGYQKGELITIASRANGGKTSLALATVLKTIENQQRVYYFSMSESSELIVSKIISQKHNIPIKDFLLNNYDKKHKQEIYTTLEMIEKYLIVEEDLFFDIYYLSQKIEYEYECDLIVIDSYSFITKQVDKNINIVRELKRLAYISKTPILLLTSFEIMTEKRFAKSPVATDIIDASDIFIYSNKVLAIYNDDQFVKRVEYIKELKSKQSRENPPYKSAYIIKPVINVEINILKNNSGEIGQKRFDFHKSLAKFICCESKNNSITSEVEIEIPDI